MYEYLIGAIVFGIPFLLFLVLRKDLRKPMMWTAIVYIGLSGTLVSFWYFLRQFVYLGEPIVPSYWYPPTFFNLGRITGFGGIEDILWLIFISGIATCGYEIVYHKKIKVKRAYHLHLAAIIISFFSFFIFQYFFPINLIYGLSFSYIIGALVLWIDRRDLAKHSIAGAAVFVGVYLIAFIIVIVVFPNFINNFYNLKKLSGIIFIGMPLEELLYAASFGLMWAPMYEYAHEEKCVDEK